MWLFFLFVAIPIIEIAFFIQIGGWLGLFPTLLIVIITAALGATLVRSQALATFGNKRFKLMAVKNPERTLADGGMILLAGVLLLTPGFFTDALGFLLLTPWFRDQVFKFIKNKFGFRQGPIINYYHKKYQRSGRRDGSSIIIEGEYQEDDKKDSQQRNF